MTQDLLVLSTAASIAIVHTLAGPDHYLPFIAMAKARRWPWLKTVWVTAGCGLGHAMGSLVLGLVGVAAGFSLERLADIDGWRGDWAAWGLIAVGLLYAAWGLKRAARTDRHSHLHVHADGTVHAHPHSHRGGHAHVHGAPGRSGLVPWSLFLIFILGLCE
ncbi:MAG: hypothetical protein D6782_02315 [Alphaproteobacteria bacterium]|nr:MAG: hypothetical protein D6782_02315 [Alphaproteobacteria bacterium]